MKKKNFFILFFLFSSILAYSNYPEIKNLHKSDSLFSQIQYELGEYYKRTQSGKSLIPLSIYRYKFKKNDSLFSISSKLNLTYDSIVTLNGIGNPDKISSGDILLIPNSPGIFINKSPMGKFEELISLRDEKGINIIIDRSNVQISCTFLSGSYLSGNERAFFLKSFF
ncbi:MAG: LysM peptidoglycan-binding domain-containing protein, partial [Deltaproteobacteria bacterium]|nr:LysM peptidoglycan-binding domain-containing protein [Deltaproteobacteria bacterium]